MKMGEIVIESQLVCLRQILQDSQLHHLFHNGLTYPGPVPEISQRRERTLGGCLFHLLTGLVAEAFHGGQGRHDLAVNDQTFPGFCLVDVNGQEFKSSCVHLLGQSAVPDRILVFLGLLVLGQFLQFLQRPVDRL